jgi:hypothetical protein
MIRFLFRFVGLILLAAAFITLVIDGTKSIAASDVTLTPLGQYWNDIHSTSLQLLQPALERHVAEWLWDPVMLNIITAPAWLVLGILAALLMLIGRKKRPPIGFGRD